MDLLQARAGLRQPDRGAGGDIVWASEDENPDLLWGIRGGGGNFGIVTTFEFRLHPLGPMLPGLALWPIDQAPRVLRGWRDHVEGAPDELSSACAVITAPPAEFVPEHLHGRVCVGLIAMYVGDPDQGAPVVQPLKDLAPDLDLIGPMPYLDFQALLDTTAPPAYATTGGGVPGRPRRRGHRHLHPPGRAAAVAAVAARHLPPGRSHRRRRPRRDRRLPRRRALPVPSHPRLGGGVRGRAPHRDGQGQARAMRPFGTGAVYLNFTPEGDRVRSAWEPDVYECLVELKRRYDPESVFRMNQNISPEAGATVAA